MNEGGETAAESDAIQQPWLQTELAAVREMPGSRSERSLTLPPYGKASKGGRREGGEEGERIGCEVRREVAVQSDQAIDVRFGWQYLGFVWRQCRSWSNFV